MRMMAVMMELPAFTTYRLALLRGGPLIIIPSLVNVHHDAEFGKFKSFRACGHICQLEQFKRRFSEQDNRLGTRPQQKGLVHLTRRPCVATFHTGSWVVLGSRRMYAIQGVRVQICNVPPGGSSMVSAATSHQVPAILSLLYIAFMVAELSCPTFRMSIFAVRSCW